MISFFQEVNNFEVSQLNDTLVLYFSNINWDWKPQVIGIHVTVLK